MKYFRAVQSGTIVWICVAVTFFILERTPFVKDSLIMQALTVSILLVFYAITGASFYYKKANINGLLLGIIMSSTALSLDLIIFVPWVEIPKGNTYLDFFSNPLLWTLAIINALTAFLYWKMKIKITQ